MYWNREAETMSRDRLQDLQLARLTALVERVRSSSPFYGKAFAETGFEPGDLRSLDDLAQLPFTTKSDLREVYPFGMLAVPKREVVRLHASSGTTGKPTVVAYSRSDMAMWAEVMARAMTAAGITADDIVHNTAAYGLFTGGLGIGLGAETVGATTVPASAGFSKRHLMLMEDFGATVLCSMPSYALVLAETAAEEHIDLRARMKLRVGIFGAEPWTDAMRREIEMRFGIEAFDVYGLSEVIGPGVSAECLAHDGLHIFEDHFLPEIIDPDTRRVLPHGSDGELVLTTLTKEAMPMIRYRTRDRARLSVDSCTCGRTFVRMSRVAGRTDDMLIVHGVNVFPSQIESALLQVAGVAPQYLIVVDRKDGIVQRLEVWVEPTEDVHRSGPSARREVEARALERLRQTLGINLHIRMVPPREIERREGKAVRVIEREKLPSPSAGK
jgi:phenylacetate-CoA ligase